MGGFFNNFIIFEKIFYMKKYTILIFTLLLSIQTYSQSEGENTDRSNVKDVPFILIENPPTYPGCVGNKQEKKRCLNNKIRRIFAGNFNGDLASNLDLPAGKYQFRVSFRINKSGYSEVLKISAPHPDIVNEFKRIITLIPKMKPATQRGVPVGVKYFFPLSWVVQ